MEKKDSHLEYSKLIAKTVTKTFDEDDEIEKVNPEIKANLLNYILYDIVKYLFDLYIDYNEKYKLESVISFKFDNYKDHIKIEKKVEHSDNNKTKLEFFTDNALTKTQYISHKNIVTLEVTYKKYLNVDYKNEYRNGLLLSSLKLWNNFREPWNNIKQSKTFSYDRNGNLTSFSSHYNGRRSGAQYIWWSNGKLKLKTNYFKGYLIEFEREWNVDGIFVVNKVFEKLKSS
jgi:antitoxin component YwqK of YwqJK toxin-antitoxin module